MYTHPIPGAPESVKLHPGAIGPLYLSREGWNATSPDGFGIYGAKFASIKFPQSAAIGAAPLVRLTVIPTSIRITGHLAGASAFFDLELLGPDAADSQDLVWNSADYLDVRLTEQGARRLNLDPTSSTVKVWPVQIAIQGAPSIDPTTAGALDLLDGELAGSMQRLVFAKQGAPIVLALTQDGIDQFHVTPQAVA
ncbi:MAG TPA: hypothetical protein VFK02_04950 [Kofleriaceae bacterium]|nr:hypothetical protein [Kofleriaceae bacterium]